METKPRNSALGHGASDTETRRLPLPNAMESSPFSHHPDCPFLVSKGTISDASETFSRFLARRTGHGLFLFPHSNLHRGLPGRRPPSMKRTPSKTNTSSEADASYVISGDELRGRSASLEGLVVWWKHKHPQKAHSLYG